MSAYRDKIISLTKNYYEELNEKDFSHNFDHILRVERLAKRIAKSESADMEIIEASSLLFDVARGLEDKGEVEEHAEAGCKIAREVLNKINFPKSKIDAVCHAILVHRKSMNREPETLEAKILQDADYLDALGSIAVMRTVASSFQSKQYMRPLYVDEPYVNDESKGLSAIHYIIHMVKHPKLQPQNFHTKLGKEIAKERYEFMKQFAERFVDEWNGEK